MDLGSNNGILWGKLWRFLTYSNIHYITLLSVEKFWVGLQMILKLTGFLFCTTTLVHNTKEKEKNVYMFNFFLHKYFRYI